MPEDEKLQHSTPEERLEQGYDIATFEDLDGLSDERLVEIAQECDLPADPDGCVPCRAFAIWSENMDEQKQAALNKLADLPVAPVADEEPEEVLDTAGLEELGIPVGRVEHEVPDVRDQFLAKAAELHEYALTMMTGPPIPPPNVSLGDLAALTLGSERWIQHLKSQVDNGYVLSDEITKISSAVQETLTRMKR